MESLQKRFSFALALLAAFFLFAAPALADALSEAKAAGLVGEKADGYLAAVAPNPAAATVHLVEDINAKRKAEYAKIAAKNGQPVSVIEKLIAAKLAAKAAPGDYFMGGDGTWVKR